MMPLLPGGRTFPVSSTISSSVQGITKPIAAGFDAGSPNRKPVVNAGARVVTGRAGQVSSPVFEPAEVASVPGHTNGATVRVGGDDDDDVDVPPFMRH